MTTASFEERIRELDLDARVYTVLALTEPPIDISQDKDYAQFLKARNDGQSLKAEKQALGAIFYDVKGELYAKYKLTPQYYKEVFDVVDPFTILILKYGKDSIGDLPKELCPVLTPDEKLLLILGKGTTQQIPKVYIDEINTDEFENLLLNYMLRGIYFLRKYEWLELEETDRILEDAERLANDGKPRKINNGLFENYKSYLRKH